MTKSPDARTVNPGHAVTYHGSAADFSDPLFAALSRGAFGESLQPSDRLRLTVDIAPDPEHPTTWVATCVELGSTSAARSPHEAFAAAAAGARLMVNAIQINRYDPSLSPEVLAALDELVIRAVKSRPRVTQPELDPSSVARADNGALVVPLSPRGDADDPEQRLLDRARRLAADPFGEY